MSLHTSEKWRDVPIQEWAAFYDISSYGRVRNKLTGLILRSPAGKFGYHTVTLKKKPNKHCVAVHALVLKAFGSPQPSAKHETCHVDGNKSNNHISNLRWGTRKENHADKIRHGKTGRKLSSEQVKEIKRLLACGEKHYRIGRRFGVGSWAITNIATGKSYFD